MRTTRPARQRRAFTLLEVCIMLAIFSMVIGYVAQTFIFASRTEVATSKKLIAGRALQYLQGRVRRDARCARFVRIVGAPDSGPGVQFFPDKASFDAGTAARARTYRWDPATQLMTIPELTSPEGTAVNYAQCRLRKVVFYRDPAEPETLKYIFSPLENTENERMGSVSEQAQRQLWGAAVMGQVELDVAATGEQFPFINDPAFTGVPADAP